MAPTTKSSRRLTVFLLRFLISKGEYERLECVLSPYTPISIRPLLPSTADFDERPRSPNREIGVIDAALGPRDDLLPGTVRQGLRVFAGTYAAATLVDVVLIGIIKRHGWVFPKLALIVLGEKPLWRTYGTGTAFRPPWRHPSQSHSIAHYLEYCH